MLEVSEWTGKQLALKLTQLVSGANAESHIPRVAVSNSKETKRIPRALALSTVS